MNPGLALPLIALKTVGQKSTHPKINMGNFRENMFEAHNDFINHTPQVLVACC
jgi:hypothetical protein